MNEWWCAMVHPKQGWVFENSGAHLDEWVCIEISVDEWEDIIDVGKRVRLIM
jgi:hypothetical protein